MKSKGLKVGMTVATAMLVVTVGYSIGRSSMLFDTNVANPMDNMSTASDAGKSPSPLPSPTSGHSDRWCKKGTKEYDPKLVKKIRDEYNKKKAAAIKACRDAGGDPVVKEKETQIEPNPYRDPGSFCWRLPKKKGGPSTPEGPMYLTFTVTCNPKKTPTPTPKPTPTSTPTNTPTPTPTATPNPTSSNTPTPYPTTTPYPTSTGTPMP